MKKIVITGPESTGKSRLAKELANYFKIPFVHEYARQYLDGLGRTYIQSDLIDITNGQINLERETKEFNPAILLCDTDVLTIKIWSEYKYGNCEEYIAKKLVSELPDLYLLCAPDIPWEQDIQRENPNDREFLFQLYKNQIKELNIQHHVIKGKNRMQKAIDFLNPTLIGK